MKVLRWFVFVLVGLFALGCVAFGVAAVSAVGASSGGASPAPGETVSYSYNLTVFGTVYVVKASTNSSLSDFGWTADGLGVQFRAVTPSGSVGFCDLTVPEALLGGDLSLFVDGSVLVRDVNFTQVHVGSDYVLHLTYGGGSRLIETRVRTEPQVSSSPSVSPSPLQGTPSPSASPTPSVSTVAWVPSVESAALAGAVAVGSTAAASAAMSLAHPAEDSIWRYFDKVKETLPDDGRKWASDFVESKKKLKVDEKKASSFLPTKQEAVAYVVGIVVLTLCYAFAKVAFDLAGFLVVLPMIMLTFIIVEFVKIFVVTVFVRTRGVWAEHKLWFLGLVLLAVTTLAFRVPLSSPSRSVRHGPKFSKRLEVIVASFETLVNLACAGIFFVVLLSGFTLLGSTGLAFCVMMAFFEILPIPPMASKEIWNHNKGLWAALFAAATAMFVAWLLLI
jgi:hypothetical protein